MNEELNKVGEILEEVNDDLNETIEVIQKEVDGFVEDVDGAIEDLDEDTKEKASKIQKDVKHAIESAVASLGKMIHDLREDEELKAKIHDFRVKSTEVINEGIVKLKGLKDDPVWQARFEKVKESTIETTEKVVDVASHASSKAMSKARENDKFDDFVDKAEVVGAKALVATKEAYETTKDKVEEFFAKPEVIEKVESAKETTIKVAEKAVDGLKKWLSPKGEADHKENE